MLRYGRYFLVSEADEDINIPATSRATDFTSLDGEPTGNEDLGDTTDVTVSPNNRGTDFTNMDEPDEGETNETPPDEGEQGNPEELDDGTDFTDGIDEPTTDDTTGEEETETPEDNDENKTNEQTPGIEYSSTRTYILYQEFEDLLETVHILISSMEKYSTNSLEKGAIAGKVLNKLRQINELLTDYMLIRFKLSSYVQNSIYYNKIVVAIKTTIDLLSTIKNVDDETDK